MSVKVLVTGGNGYIGSHTVVDLVQSGYEVVSFDNFSNSSKNSLKNAEKIVGGAIPTHEGDLRKIGEIRRVFEANKDIKGIIHFAALKSVGESVHKPDLYYDNNINGLINLLICAKEYGVENFVFSSSCSVYGNTTELPVTEMTKLEKAESPYAFTKQIGEQILMNYAEINKNIRISMLRYFNPAGAHPSALIGEDSINMASNLVPIITETAIGKRKQVTVFGSDYDTVDGTCVRDYIHVMDIAVAHRLSLEYLSKTDLQKNIEVFNLGTGKGSTVLEVIRAFEKVTHQKLNYKIGERRAGDVVSIYANYDKALKHLGWQPQYTIEDIMSTAWEWEKVR